MPSLKKCLGKGEKAIFFQLGELIKCCNQEETLFSLLRGFGFLVPQPRQIFLPGKQLGVKSLHLTSFKKGVGSFPIGVFCVNVMKRRSTIFSCTALSLGPYGISFFLWLASNGCSPG